MRAKSRAAPHNDALPLTAPDRRAPRWRKSLVVALLLGAASGLGAWFIAAPLRATPARVVPEADLGLPDGTARVADGRVAASTVPAPGAPAASAASAAREDPARCGEDQLAQSKLPEPDAEGGIMLEPGTPDPDGVVRASPWQTKPAGVGYTGAMQRLDASLRASTDPFDRTLADWLNLGGVFGDARGPCRRAGAGRHHLGRPARVRPGVPDLP